MSSLADFENAPDFVIAVLSMIVDILHSTTLFEIPLDIILVTLLVLGVLIGLIGRALRMNQ